MSKDNHKVQIILRKCVFGQEVSKNCLFRGFGLEMTIFLLGLSNMAYLTFIVYVTVKEKGKICTFSLLLF